MPTATPLLALLLAASPLSLAAPVLQPNVEVTGASLTIPARGKASVTERRTFALAEGASTLKWDRVSRRLDRDSLQLRFPRDPVAVLSRRFEPGLGDRNALLNRYIGERVQLIHRDAQGRETLRQEGVLLGVEGSRPAMIRLAGGEVVVNPGGELLLPPLPADVARAPRVDWRVRSPQSLEAEAEMAYATEGLNWTVNYLLTLAEDLSEAELSGWVTVTNTTGVAFTEAEVRLESIEKRTTEALQPVTETEVVEYPLSEVGDRLTIPADEPVRASLMSRRVVPLTSVFLFDPLGATPAGPTPPQKLKHVVRLANTEANGLGVNLPGGRGLVYRETRKGVKLVVDRSLPGTGKDKDLEIVLGDVGNLEGSRKQTAFKEVAERTQEQDLEIKLNNKTAEWVEVLAVERPWPQWEIIEASHYYRRRPDKALEFPVMLAPQATTTVKYRVRMKY